MNTIKSEFLSLGKNDVVKAIIVAIFAPVAGYVGQILVAFSNGGSFAFSFTTAFHLGLSAGIAYLVKNFLTNSQDSFLTGEPTTTSTTTPTPTP